jgi:vacuolar-type H+-ATPase subunit I/STV1
MSPRTAFLSKLIGLYCVLISLSMIAHGQVIAAAANDLMHSPAVMLLSGVFALACGLAMVLCHNVWSGGAAPVTITLLGWSSLIKGVFFLFVSQETAAGLYGGLHYDRYLQAYGAGTLVLGIYLTYSGFRPAARQPAR